QDWPLAVDAVIEAAREEFDEDDDVKPMIFGKEARMLEFGDLRRVTPNGPTLILGGVEVARRHLDSRQAGRKVLVLVTDGETVENPEDLKAAMGKLGDIGLFVVTTKADAPGAKENLHIKDWSELRKRLRAVAKGMQDLVRENPGPVDLRTHPATAGAPSWTPASLQRTTAKAGAQVVATVGRAPTQDPVLAFGNAGRGRVAALTVDLASV